MASAKFISIRSPDQSRKAIFSGHRGRGAFSGIRAIEIRGFEEGLRARDGST